MNKYILKRLLFIVPILVGVTFLSFSLLYLAPGDAAEIFVNPNMTQEEIQLKRVAMGLDQPFMVQYVKWFFRAVQGDFGYLFATNQPVIERVAERIMPTLSLTFWALALSYLVAVPMGVISAVRKNTFIDYANTFFSFVGVSAPNYFIGLVFIYFFSLKLNIFPSGGMNEIGAEGNFLDGLLHLILPMCVIGMQNTGIVLRYTRSGMLEVLSQDYIRTALALGIGKRRIYFRYALKNTLLPIISLIGSQFSVLFGGAVITEYVFNWPGMGSLMIDSINSRDYPTVLGINLVIAFMIILGNLTADILYSVVDPRIHISADK